MIWIRWCVKGSISFSFSWNKLITLNTQIIGTIQAISLFASKKERIIFKWFLFALNTTNAWPPIWRFICSDNEVTIFTIDRFSNYYTLLTFRILSVIPKNKTSNFLRGIIEIHFLPSLNHYICHDTIFAEIKVTGCTVIALNTSCLIEISNSSKAIFKHLSSITCPPW